MNGTSIGARKNVLLAGDADQGTKHECILHTLLLLSEDGASQTSIFKAWTLRPTGNSGVINLFLKHLTIMSLNIFKLTS